MSKDDLFFEGDPLDHPTWKEAAKAEKKVKHQTSDFVGCPISWLERALPYLGGEHQVVVAMLLYRRWVLCGRRRTFGFPNGDLKKLGIDRHAKRKAVAGLEQAGLIAVEYLPGHAVLVTRRWR